MDEGQMAIPTIIIDSADFFASRILKKFPELEVRPELMNAWRPRLAINLTQGFTEREALEELCYTLQERLFWRLEVLVAYAISDFEEQETKPESVNYFGDEHDD